MSPPPLCLLSDCDGTLADSEFLLADVVGEVPAVVARLAAIPARSTMHRT